MFELHYREWHVDPNEYGYWRLYRSHLATPEALLMAWPAQHSKWDSVVVYDPDTVDDLPF